MQLSFCSSKQTMLNLKGFLTQWTGAVDTISTISTLEMSVKVSFIINPAHFAGSCIYTINTKVG